MKKHKIYKYICTCLIIICMSFLCIGCKKGDDNTFRDIIDDRVIIVKLNRNTDGENAIPSKDIKLEVNKTGNNKYDISLINKYTNEEYQPIIYNEEAVVQIETKNTEDFFVLHTANDGYSNFPDIVKKDNCIEFKTNHFSEYSLLQTMTYAGNESKFSDFSTNGEYKTYTDPATEITYYYTSLSKEEQLAIGGFYKKMVSGEETNFAAKKISVCSDSQDIVLNPNKTGHFSNSTNLTVIDLEKFDFSELSSMENMFSGCTKLSSLNITKIDFSKCTSVKSMLNNCSSLSGTLDLANSNIYLVSNWDKMLYGCGQNSNMLYINLENMDGSYITSMNATFSNATANIKATGFNPKNVTNLSQCFLNFKALGDTLELNGWTLKKIETISNMFVQVSNTGGYTTNDTYLKLNDWEIHNLTSIKEIHGGGAPINFSNIEMKNWYLPSVTNLDNFLSFSETNIWKEGRRGSGIYNLSGWNCPEVTKITSFYGSGKSHSLNLANWDCPKLTDISSMFNSWCSTSNSYPEEQWASLDMSNWNAPIELMEKTFYSCMYRGPINLTGFNFSKLISMKGCFALNGGISTFNVVTDEKVSMPELTNLNGAFNTCSKMISMDISGWDMPKVNDIGNAWYASTLLRELNLPKWNCTIDNWQSAFDTIDVDSLDLSGISFSDTFVNNIANQKLGNLEYLMKITLPKMPETSSMYSFMTQPQGSLGWMSEEEIKNGYYSRTKHFQDLNDSTLKFLRYLYCIPGYGLEGNYYLYKGTDFVYKNSVNDTTINVVVPYGSKYYLPEWNIEGYEVEQWYFGTNDAGTTVTDTDAIPSYYDEKKNAATAKYELYAKMKIKSYGVSFNSNGGTTFNSESVEHGNTIDIDNYIPTKEGHIFAGWFTDENFITPYDENTQIKDNLTLYAKWNSIEVKISFETNGGSKIDAQTINYGETGEKPVNPTKEGYTFAGWYYDNNTFKQKCTFENPVNEDITVYAKWNKASYTVTFNSNGGTEIDKIKVYHGEKIPTPDNPVKTGYNFLGWYTDNNTFYEKFDFKNTEVTKNITLYAAWEEHIYYIAFDSNGGSGIMDDMKVKYSQKCKLPKNNFIKEGYTFVGWSTDNSANIAKYTDQQEIQSLTSMSDRKIILYAVWNEKVIAGTTGDNTNNTNKENVKTKDSMYEIKYLIMFFVGLGIMVEPMVFQLTKKEKKILKINLAEESGKYSK